MELSLDEIKTIEFSDHKIYMVEVSIFEKVLIIRGETGWIPHGKKEYVDGKGTVYIKGWDKIMVSFGSDINIKPVELPFGTIESLKEIYEFEILPDKIHIGGFSMDNSGKWIDYDIIKPLELKADFIECEVSDTYI